MWVALAIVLLAAASSTEAFVRLNGNSDFYVRCDPEGSYCHSDSGCCQGLECAIENNNLQGMGGICRRRGSGGSDDAAAAAAAASNFELPSQSGFLSRSCNQDSDCPAGQCCNRRPIGFRGSLVGSCETDCSYREFGDVLGDYYSRFYRRAARGKSLHHGGHLKHRQHKTENKHEKHEEHGKQHHEEDKASN